MNASWRGLRRSGGSTPIRHACERAGGQRGADASCGSVFDIRYASIMLSGTLQLTPLLLDGEKQANSLYNALGKVAVSADCAE
jgi:hypothetical protein